MIKVTKVGKLPCHLEYAITCKVCRTEFTFARTDIKTEYYQDQGSYKYIPCPVCTAELSPNHSVEVE